MTYKIIAIIKADGAKTSRTLIKGIPASEVNNQIKAFITLASLNGFYTESSDYSGLPVVKMEDYSSQRLTIKAQEDKA